MLMMPTFLCNPVSVDYWSLNLFLLFFGLHERRLLMGSLFLFHVFFSQDPYFDC